MSIFVDTGAWFASVVKTDANYPFAQAWLTKNSSPLLTTDYVIDETLTLLRARGERQKAIQLGHAFFSGSLAEIYVLSESDIRETWRQFVQFFDKDWSFTDVSSKVVIEKMGITDAFAFDHHFKQFGSVTVVPS